MCGISGIYGLSSSGSAAIVGKMNSCISHRGPDDEGIFTSGKVSLGHRRLSIIDLSSAGHQPMVSSDDRYVIVFNGEIYNFRDLRLDLQRVQTGGDSAPYDFNTQTDTEVILAAWSRWGEKCLDRLNGMFVFALWDKEKEELFIARDRIGKKPLYYHYQNGVLTFASELRAVLQNSAVERKTDAAALTDYLRYQTVHAPDTIVKDVKMLMPGHFIRLNAEGFSISKYWDLFSGLDPKVKEKSYEQIKTDVFRIFAASVERRLVADVPFGAFLSGGIDSSAVVGLMSRVMGQKVKTFSIVFDDPEFTEAKYARMIAEKFQTDHHEINLKVSQLLEILPSALDSMDHPSGDGPNTWLVSKATKEAGVTMALSGLGGDELFAGYDIFRRSVSLQKKRWLNAVPSPVRGLAGEMLKVLKPGTASEKMSAILSSPSVDFQFAYPLSRQVLTDSRIHSLFPSAVRTNTVKNIIREFEKIPDDFTLTRVSMAEISTYMQNVLLRDTDQMSMAHALEVRVPFLDHTLIQYVLSVPDKYKYPQTPKKLLVDSLGDILPSEIVNRPKMGFTFPWKHWMKNDLKEFCFQNLNHLHVHAGFSPHEVMTLWNKFLADDKNVTWSRIWHLVVLGYWLHKNEVRL